MGFYFQQFKALAAVPNVRYFYLDWLGMGCSGRPSFPNIKHGDKTEAAAKKRVTEAEAWFTTSLDECRQKLGVAKINTLCGHSIGGYLSAVGTFVLFITLRLKTLTDCDALHSPTP